MMKVCRPMMAVRPAASSFSNGDSTRMAIRRPAPTMSRKPMSTATVPIRPSSSPMAAKMKSVETAGMRWGFPCPRLVPVRPPAAKANMACTVW
jgi:hypothetical protein